MKQLLYFLLLLPGLAWAQSKPSPYDSAHFSWRKPVPRDKLRDLQPDRPGVTESPFTVDAGHFQLEMDALRLINSGSDQDLRTRDIHVAYSMLKLGLSRKTDLQLEVPLYSNAKQRSPSAEDWEERHAGFGDLALRVKHNFIGDDQQGHFAMAVIGYARLPTGGAVGSGAVEYGLVLPLDVEVAENTNLEAQLETDYRYDRNNEQRYWCWQPSVAIEQDFGKKLGIIVEGVGRWESQDKQWQTSLNLAPIFKLTENLQLDLGTHLALDRQIDHEYFLGITVRR